MARFFLNVKLFSDQFSLFVTRKGYAVAASGGGRRGGELSNVMMKQLKGGDEESVPKSPWVPDPVTGYYRPENQADQIDAVELRRMLLKSNFKRH
ncbi:protein SENESCENCE-ASSOCIATED GENE 21, mitochondrial-like [Solanum dulcamara]|uniref:protein SENESCENCE-ASSOCIATED GENE 21, mitochondrial-like n=1 Tax=Solanum dulcamara TaxID=45834 RepID=UPI002486CDE9|nr:protein SENESCENCE-ASSOCIATED GENE 21, mitochondrial-like [Solanum dulcamara]